MSRIAYPAIEQLFPSPADPRHSLITDGVTAGFLVAGQGVQWPIPWNGRQVAVITDLDGAHVTTPDGASFASLAAAGDHMIRLTTPYCLDQKLASRNPHEIRTGMVRLFTTEAGLLWWWLHTDVADGGGIRGSISTPARYLSSVCGLGWSDATLLRADSNTCAAVRRRTHGVGPEAVRSQPWPVSPAALFLDTPLTVKIGGRMAALSILTWKTLSINGIDALLLEGYAAMTAHAFGLAGSADQPYHLLNGYTLLTLPLEEHTATTAPITNDTPTMAAAAFAAWQESLTSI